MMEKYAVDLDLIPPTDEQLSYIKSMLGHKDMPLIKTASQADEVIKTLEVSINE